MAIKLNDRDYYIIAFILLAFLLIESVYTINYYSPTFDENSYIGASYYHWKTGNITIAREHPPLTRIIAGAPLILLNLEYPEGDWNNSRQWEFGKLFLYESGNDLDLILFSSRLSIIFLSLLFGLSLFLFVKSVYGYRAGIFVLFLYSFEPTIIAHSSLVTTDIAVTVFMFFTIYMLWNFVKSPNINNALFVAIPFALAQVSKFSALYLIPIMFVLFVFLFYKKLLTLRSIGILVLVIAAVSLLTINIFYLFQGTGMALTDNISKDRIEPHITNNPFKALILAGAEIPLPLPENYVLGLSDVILHDLSGHKSFFLGEYSRFGWWYYFPVLFVLKISIVLLVFIAISARSFYTHGFEKNDSKVAEYMAIIFVLMFFVINFFSSINIGIRHILPIFPFVLFLVSKSVKYVKINSQEFRVYLLLAVIFALSSLSAAPHYISFFNEAIGNNGYLYAGTSNTDWGQDIKPLFIWLDEQDIGEVSYRVSGEFPVVYYSEEYGITSTEILDCNPVKGVVAISTDMLTDVSGLDENHKCFDWVKGYEIMTRIDSIFVFNVGDLNE